MKGELVQADMTAGHETCQGLFRLEVFNEFCLLKTIIKTQLKQKPNEQHNKDTYISRPKGGIEPLRRQSATGLKPAPQTTEVHPGTY